MGQLPFFADKQLIRGLGRKWLPFLITLRKGIKAGTTSSHALFLLLCMGVGHVDSFGDGRKLCWKNLIADYFSILSKLGYNLFSTKKELVIHNIEFNLSLIF